MPEMPDRVSVFEEENVVILRSDQTSNLAKAVDYYLSQGGWKVVGFTCKERDPLYVMLTK